MEFVSDILFWIHLTALAMGGAATFGIPVIGSKMRTASAETRPVLLSAVKGISNISRIALGLLVISGPLMVWTNYGGDFSGFGPWFWAKMVGVVILLLGVIYAGILLERTMKGDMSAAQRQPIVGMTLLVVLLAVIFCAVMTFH